jgi:hypothetical protein
MPLMARRCERPRRRTSSRISGESPERSPRRSATRSPRLCPSTTSPMRASIRVRTVSTHPDLLAWGWRRIPASPRTRSRGGKSAPDPVPGFGPGPAGRGVPYTVTRVPAAGSAPRGTSTNTDPPASRARSKLSPNRPSRVAPTSPVSSRGTDPRRWTGTGGSALECAARARPCRIPAPTNARRTSPVRGHRGHPSALSARSRDGQPRTSAPTRRPRQNAPAGTTTGTAASGVGFISALESW